MTPVNPPRGIIRSACTSVPSASAPRSDQAQIQATGSIDVNINGAGEFGYFAELGGGVGLRDSAGKASSELLSPSVLSSGFNNVATEASINGGIVVRSGYRFQMFLPSTGNFGVPENDTGGVGSLNPEARLAESLWCCYAWPVAFGNSGRRAFFINQHGEILATSNIVLRYGDGPMAPTSYAAQKRNTYNYMASTIAANSTGWDLQQWIVVN